MGEKRELTDEERAVAKRLRDLWNQRKDDLGLTQAKAGERMGVSQGMIGHYLNGRRPMDAGEVLVFAKMLQVDPEEIWPGFREKYGWPNQKPPNVVREMRPRYDDGTEEVGQSGNTEQGPVIKGVHPVVSWVQAGDPELVSDPFPAGVSDEWHPCPVPCSEQTFILRVKGPSMEPEYQEGDLIYVDPQRRPEHGKDVVVRFEGQEEATFKRLIVDGGQYYLQALNPDWPRQFIPIDDEATLCGVVVFSGKVR